MAPAELTQEIMNLSERDREKLMVLMRSFATGEDLAAFIEMTQAVHKEQEHRAWAWGVIKKVAAGIVLAGATAAAIKNGVTGEWWVGK